MKELLLEITTPSKVAYTGNIKSVTIPGTLGSFQVLFNHAPLISSFEIGLIKIVEENGSVRYFATGGGTVEVKDNKVLVLAESFEEAMQIDLERAKRAMDRAKERLKDRSQQFEVDRAQASLARAMNRINIASKYK
ncbi:MAG: F0F1 ATP synthase subunit epsilon [Syntrophomonadaceae bacterium]